MPNHSHKHSRFVSSVQAEAEDGEGEHDQCADGEIQAEDDMVRLCLDPVSAMLYMNK